jgi:chemotaxis protein MotA
MISLPIGLIAIGAVLGFALTGKNMAVLINPHSLILVVGGTIGVLALASPMKDIKGMLRALVQLWKKDKGTAEIHQSLMELAKRRDANLKVTHPLLSYAQELWEQGTDPEVFAFLLGQRREELNAMSERILTTIRNLAKYPPALGMTGTVVGMVSIFSSLNAENRAKLGPSLALAMTATFYGLVMANMILLPLADRLQIGHLAKKKSNEYIFRALLLIHRGESQNLIGEEVNAVAA